MTRNFLTGRQSFFAAGAVLVIIGGIAKAEEITLQQLKPSRDKVCDLPYVDLSTQPERVSMIAQGTKEIYQGHPHTVLMPDGKTIFAAWTYNHGGVAGPLKRSDDGGLSWSELLPVPESWQNVKNCPTLHNITAPDGTTRLFVFAGNGAMYQSYSTDAGHSFSEMTPNGLKCIVAPISVLPVDHGKKWLMWYHRGVSDEMVAERADKSRRDIWQSASTDGGLTWGESKIICTLEGGYPCEPAVIASPDGSELMIFVRENRRTWNSLFATSKDEGRTWSPLQELPASLTGDRHAPIYSSDGRLLVVFRDLAQGPTRGHFVGWVGRFEDIQNGKDGEYRVKLLHHHGRPLDTGYPGLELLPDGTFVATTYCQMKDGERNSVVAVRFKLSETDTLPRVKVDRSQWEKVSPNERNTP